jgi:AraC-like DNA-binding protein
LAETGAQRHTASVTPGSLTRDTQVSESVRGRPAERLRGLVAAYDGYRQRGDEPARHLGLSSPFMTLIVTLDEPVHVIRHVDRARPPARYEALVGGLHASPVVIGHDGAQSGIQLRVSPLASRALFGVPAAELAGLDLPASDVLGGLASELHERIAAAPSWRERFAILDRALTRRMTETPEIAAPVVQAWQLILASAGSAPVAIIAREVGWSERHLTKRFSREVGLTPKLASRIVRFHRARRALQSQLAAGGRPEIAWTAADCGYADQSHLVRDFRAFAELPPARWLREEFGNVQDEPPSAIYCAAHEHQNTPTPGLANASRP